MWLSALNLIHVHNEWQEVIDFLYLQLLDLGLTIGIAFNSNSHNIMSLLECRLGSIYIYILLKKYRTPIMDLYPSAMHIDDWHFWLRIHDICFSFIGLLYWWIYKSFTDKSLWSCYMTIALLQQVNIKQQRLSTFLQEMWAP